MMAAVADFAARNRCPGIVPEEYMACGVGFASAAPEN